MHLQDEQDESVWIDKLLLEIETRSTGTKKEDSSNNVGIFVWRCKVVLDLVIDKQSKPTHVVMRKGLFVCLYDAWALSKYCKVWKGTTRCAHSACQK